MTAAEPWYTAAEIAETVAITGNGQPDGDRNPWQPINLNTLPDKPPVQPTLGGIGIVYPGKRHVFSGPPESAKTLAAYLVLIQVARHNGTGILIDFEMGGWDARARLQELGATTQEIDRIHYLEPDQPATTTDIILLAALKPELVVVDAGAGAYTLQGLDDNKRGDVEKLASLYVGIFWRHGIASIVVDHVVKNTETRGRFVIGSERKLGGADVHLGFDTITPISRGTSGRYKITTHKDRGGYLKRGHIADLQLDSDPDTHAIAWAFVQADTPAADEPFRPTVLMERVSRFLSSAGEPLSFNQILTGVKGHNDHAKRDAIAALIREGYATETAGSRGARLVTFVRSFSQADTGSNQQKPLTSATSADLGPTSASRSHHDLGHLGPPLRGPAGVDAEVPNTTSAGWFDTNGTFNDSHLDELARTHLALEDEEAQAAHALEELNP